MATAVLPPTGIALYGAPDADIETKEAKSNAIQVMQLEMTQSVVDELLQCVRSGKPPQILFGRAPQLKYGDKVHVLQTTSESLRYELYQSTESDDDDHLAFAGLINHSLAVQKAEQVTAGVDTALETLKNSMAALSEAKEANKTIVHDASPIPSSHRRFPSKSFRPQQHLKQSSSVSSPLRSAPSSPATMSLSQSSMKAAPTSQPNIQADSLRALRVPLIHLLAIEPRNLNWISRKTRGKINDCKEILGKIAKPGSTDSSWHLSDKAYKELDPWKFPYPSPEDRQKAIDSAIKAFDRLRLAKDDKLWQILLPKQERGKGKVLSRLNVTAPSQKSATPLQKISKLTEKKAVAGAKTEEKDSEREGKKVKEKPEKKAGKGGTAKDVKSTAAKSSAPQPEIPKARTKNMAKTTVRDASSMPRQKPKGGSKDVPPRENKTKPSRPAANANNKPKNPSPLSASPPVNASDLEDSHPVHKALSAAPSPAKLPSGNSDRTLKRKANDLDDSVHNHNLSVKQRKMDRPTPTTTPLGAARPVSTPSSGQSLKRKADNLDSDISRSHTPNNNNSKHRKVDSIDTVAASRYNPAHNGSSPQSDTSTSPPLQLSFRQTVELSQKFQRYYERYEKLYWQLYEADKAPSETQREELMKMHTKLEEMKREIKAGAGKN
ncbi:hypothetical protein AOQ84DRAFT_305585 [Glonium stellatum]|uniref:RNA polymerase II elongation factor ELL N-terminal domain-containing protein n=1 Tax=Glonium stellatum TaxID=574774 RepID=A0A8E2EPI9_9PEZI|nr:hypothetical protein AOQ84DRAFT_305585 [Glonium stellatum]